MRKTIVHTSIAAIFAFLVSIELIAAAFAQPKQQGYLGKGQDQYSVFIFGDALAGGLWAGSARITLGHSRIKLNGRYREGSGLAKPQFYNWEKRLPSTLESKQVDIAVVFIGTNDAQNIRRNGEYLVFNSEQWREVYTNTVATMMTQLTTNKTAVYWVEVPPVSRPELDQRLKIISAIHKTQAIKAGVRFVETRKTFTTSDDKFTFKGASIDGTVIRLRSRNGIRFIKPGNDKLASLVLEQIERDISIADGDKPVADFPVPDSSNIASKYDAPYAGPIFGLSSSDGTTVIVQPENMPLAGVGQSSNVLVSLPTFGSKTAGANQTVGTTNAAIIDVLKKQVPKNSLAGSLFNTGTWPTAQSGRADNFSSPSQ